MLLFGILLTTLGLYQATVVPAHNQAVEQQHSDTVRGEMVTLRNALVDAGLHGEARGVTVTTRTDYPVRPVSINPPDPGGSLRTTPAPDAIQLSGVTAADPEAAEYWTDREWSFDSKHLSYRPDYNYYQNPPTVRYEPTVLYSDFRGGQVVDADQRLIDGDQLNVVLLDGTYGTTADRASLDIRADSSATRERRVTAADGASMTVRTHLTADRWRDMLADQPRATLESYDASGDGPAVATIALEPGEYTLRVGRAGLGTTTTPSPAYVVATDDTDRTVPGGVTVDLEVRVLDRFGNPVSGVTINGPDDTTATTDRDGIATFEYRTPTTESEATPTVWFGGAEPSAVPDHQRVDYNLQLSGGASADGSGAHFINPGTGFTLQWATMEGPDSVTLMFENRGSATATVQSARINHYHTSPPGTGPSERRIVTNATAPVIERQLEVGGETVPATEEFAAAGGEEFTTTMTFDGRNGASGMVDEGDYFVLTLTFDDGSTRVYFITPGEES